MRLLNMTQRINFGEIWLADLSPRQGTELGKTRPILIMQAQALLDSGHSSTLIIPLTTNILEGFQYLRMRIKAVDNLEKDSDLLIDQVRAIDNKRLIKGPLTTCDETFMRKVHEKLLKIIGFKSPSP